MHKILLIVQREYLQRVRKKSFLLMTALGPLFFSLLLIIPGWLSLASLDKKPSILLLDKKHYAPKLLNQNDAFTVIPSTSQDFNQSFTYFSSSSLSYFLFIPATKPPVLFEKEPLLPSIARLLQEQINKIALSRLLDSAGIDKQAQQLSVIQTEKLYTEKASSKFEFTSGISILLGIVIYLFILAYTMQVMRGVIEEKTGRIAEVVLTTVKAETLMFGKIIGIGLVSLSQFLIWLFIASTASFLFFHRYGSALALFSNAHIQQTIQLGSIDPVQALQWNQIISAFNSIDFAFILPIFLLYFILGYLFYSAIFASVGALVDSETDTQQFIFPLTLPILLCFTLLQYLVGHPNGTIAYIFVLLPFTSPVAVMFLLPQGIPPSLLFLSLCILCISFIFTAWTAGKVFRNGILFTEKKVRWKNIKRWFFDK